MVFGLCAVLVLAGLLSSFQHQTAQPQGDPGDYGFLNRQTDGTPFRWNPCEPLHYVTNLSLAPPGAAADVAEAVSRVSSATGIRFVDDGSTTETVLDRAQTDHFILGGGNHLRWAPVLIAWESADSFDRLTDDHRAVGLGLPVHEVQTYVSGFIALKVGGRVSGYQAGWELVVQHELGHLVGLAHVHARGGS